MRPHGLAGKRILLVGGAGFIGGNLIPFLAPDNRVCVVDNLYRQPAPPVWIPGWRSVDFIRADISDPATVARLPADWTHIVHLAAVAGVRTVAHDPLRATRTNLQGALNIVALAERAPALERILFCSSSEVYGRHADRVAEDCVGFRFDTREPRWSYAVDKMATELLLLQLWRQNRLPVTIARLFNTYGPGQIGESAVSNFARRALAGQPLVVYAPGTHGRSWCHVDDCAAGLLAALESESAIGEALNLGNPDSVSSVLDLAHRIRRLAASKSEIVLQPTESEDVEQRVPDIGKARRLLGFAPAIPLDKGLSQTIAWYADTDLRQGSEG